MAAVTSAARIGVSKQQRLLGAAFDSRLTHLQAEVIKTRGSTK